jgi:CheY-like chemotaxis protein
MILVKDTEAISLADFKKDVIFYYDNCDLSTILEFCASIMNMRIKSMSKKIDFSYNIFKGVPNKINTDETRLKQILLNILSNSLKFTEKGSIHLTIEREEDIERIDENNFFILKFTIVDTGIGISKMTLNRLFTPFNKSEEKNNKSGSGLGIVIIKDMIEKLGGRITISSEKGTKVEVRIPINNSKIREQKYRSIYRKKKDKMNNSVTFNNNATLKPTGLKMSAADQIGRVGRMSISSSSKNLRPNINNVNVSIKFINVNNEEWKELPSLKTNTKFCTSKNVPDKRQLEIENMKISQPKEHNSSIDNLLFSENRNIILDPEIRQINEFHNDKLANDSSADEEEEVIRILLIDDEVLTRSSAKRQIHNFFNKKFENGTEKYEVVEANDGLDGLYHLIESFKMKSSGFDLIISDLEMSNLSGLQLAKLLYEMEYFQSKNIKFFLLSAQTNKFNFPYIQACFEKPLTESKLNSILSSFIYE